ncbi:MAG: DUF1549 domain-containing protein, partial [Phycisphaerae bacterium]|nr:DUF1549 domain-containing protein [Phycisphaerae bacterium]
MLDRFALATATVAVLVFGPPAVRGVENIDFNRDVRPILADNCYACHGPDAGQRKGGIKGQGGLRLDVRESALADLGGYAAVVPGSPDKSELVRRILAEDPDDRMPPVKHRKKLSDAQKQTLMAWVRGGAAWSEHWSFIPPTKPAVPAVSGGEGLGSVDRFITSELQRQGLAPSAEAERRILVRRLSFDLTGLPPTRAEVQAFLADRDPEAYEKLVDRLLESPHYGERMAMYWLDVVRFADSNGYHSDEARSVGPFREYVIDSFNANKPFDQFLTEQLAGDLLPNATIEQKVASGFNMLLQTTNEGGAQAKEYLAKYMADRVRNTGTIFLGVTTGCAECHDHKFDPFTTKDFYSFGAFFADIREAGKGNPPTYSVPSRKNQDAIKQIDAQVVDLRAQLSKPTPHRLAAQRKWEQDLRAKLKSSSRTDFAWFEDKKIPKGKRDGAWNYVTRDKSPVFSGALSRRQQGGGIIQHFVQGAKDTIKVGAGDVFFAYVWIDPKNPPKTVMLQFNDGSWEHRAYWGEDRISFGGIGKDTPGHRRLGPLPKAGQWVRLEATPKQVG